MNIILKKFTVLLVLIFPICFARYSFAKGAIYETTKLGENKIKITLRWSNPEEKKGISISYYHLKNGKTLDIGYEAVEDGKGQSSIDFSLAGAISPIRIILSDISVPQELPFKDIKNTEAEEYIRHLHDAGIVNGKEGDYFKPKDRITRAEFMVLADKSLGIKPSKVENLKFKDISKHWAKEYIYAAAQKGLISGYNDGNFRPDNPVTIGEACTIILKAFKLDTNYNGIYDKLHTGRWYSTFVKKIFDLKILKTDDSIYRNFNEETFINRANCAMILSRALST